MQLASWYAIPYGALGRQFIIILTAEWQGVLNISCTSNRPLIFTHVILTKKLGVCRSREIRARVKSRMELWERGLHAGLVGDREEEVVSREDRASKGGEDEDKAIARNYHSTVLLVKLG